MNSARFGGRKTAIALLAAVGSASGSLGLIAFNRQQNARAMHQIDTDWNHYGNSFVFCGDDGDLAMINAWGRREIRRQQAWRDAPFYKQLHHPSAVNPDPFTHESKQ